MKITKNQEEILNSFICERFRDNSKNFELLSEFKNEKGNTLLDYLIKYGKDGEYNNDTAYYIIKNNYNKPLMFFSLKCGSVFETYEKNENDMEYQRIILILQAIKNSSNENSDESLQAVR